MTDNLRETSGWIRKYLFSKPHTFVLEDLCWNLVTKVLEDWPFVLEDMWLKPTFVFLESDHICAGRFVLESARKSSRIVSIRAWRFVAESEHVRGGILGHSWQKLKWLNPIRSWIEICSFAGERLHLVTYFKTNPNETISRGVGWLPFM